MRDILIYIETGFDPVSLPASSLIVEAVIFFVVNVAFYLLRAFGLYALAKRQNLDKPWLCFLPIVWLFFAGKLMGTIIIGGKPYKGFALLATIVFGVGEILSLVTLFLAYFPLVGYYFSGGEVCLADAVIYENVLGGMGYVPYAFNSGAIYVKKYIAYPYGNYITVKNVVTILSLFVDVLSIANLVFSLLIFVGLFRKFWPQHYILATVLSVMGLFPIMVFIIRKNKAINFNDYIRSRYYGHGYQPFNGTNMGNGTTDNGFSGKGEEGGSGRVPPNPFSEFDDDNDKTGGDSPFGF